MWHLMKMLLEALSAIDAVHVTVIHGLVSASRSWISTRNESYEPRCSEELLEIQGSGSSRISQVYNDRGCSDQQKGQTIDVIRQHSRSISKFRFQFLLLAFDAFRPLITFTKSYNVTTTALFTQSLSGVLVCDQVRSTGRFVQHMKKVHFHVDYFLVDWWSWSVVFANLQSLPKIWTSSMFLPAVDLQSTPASTISSCGCLVQVTSFRGGWFWLRLSELCCISDF